VDGIYILDAGAGGNRLSQYILIEYLQMSSLSIYFALQSTFKSHDFFHQKQQTMTWQSELQQILHSKSLTRWRNVFLIVYSGVSTPPDVVICSLLYVSCSSGSVTRNLPTHHIASKTLASHVQR